MIILNSHNADFCNQFWQIFKIGYKDLHYRVYNTLRGGWTTCMYLENFLRFFEAQRDISNDIFLLLTCYINLPENFLIKIWNKVICWISFEFVMYMYTENKNIDNFKNLIYFIDKRNL